MKLKVLAVLAAVLGFGAVAQAETVSVATSTGTFINGNSSRRHLYIYNFGPGIVYLATTGPEAVAAKGYILKSSDTLVMQDFAGSLYGSASATSDVRVIKQAR